jgi:putative inorganic carbon (hco3(-)) transporter
MTSAASFSRHDWWRPAVSPRARDVGAPSQRSPVAFWALMFFMFSLLIAPQSFVPGLGALHLAAVAVAVAITAHLTTAFNRGQSIFGGHPSMLWAGALACWALLTAPFSYWPGGTVSLLLDLYFKSLVIFWLLSVVLDTQRRLRQFVTWLTVLTIPIGTTAIMHYLTGTFVEGGNAEAPRIMGYDAPLTANPNDLALVLCMMLPLAVALAVAQRHVFGRLAFLAIAGLDIVAVILTFSRTGFVTLAALAVVGMFKLSRGPARLWIVGIVVCGLALVPLLPEGYLQHMGTITAIETDPTGSAQNRWSDTLTAANLVLASPIVGAGAGMSALALNEARGAAWVPVHNVYLEYATDLGVPGLLLFLLLLGSCLRKVNQVVRRTAEAGVAWDFRCIAQGVQMTLVAFVVAGFFHPVAYHFHFYYAAGLSAALAVVWENEHASST